MLRNSPLSGLARLLRYALTDSLYILLGSWQEAIGLKTAQPVNGITFLSWGIGLLAAAVVMFSFRFLYTQKETRQTLQLDKAERKWFLQAIVIGLLVVLLGPVPIWLTGAQTIGDVHANRFALGSMFGASLLIVALIEWAASPKRHAKAIILALLIGLSVSFHVRVSDEYRLAQANFRSFFWQLSWRAPQLEPHTAILARDETYPAQLSTIASAFNLAHPAPPAGQQDLNHWAYRILPDAEPASDLPLSFQSQYRTLHFNASASDSLVLYQKPDRSSCLWVLHEIDQHNPDLPENLRSRLPLSNMARIKSQPSNEDFPPAVMFGEAPADEWCYLFEKAELAVQEEDWASMRILLDSLEKMGAKTEHGNAREWLPFIIGYAHNNDLDTALSLIRQTAELNPAYAPMLCQVWNEIKENTPVSPGQENSLQAVQDELECD